MCTKWLKNTIFLTILALAIAAPFHYSVAATFNVQSVIDLVNKDRQVRGITPLTVDSELSQAAEEKANDMIVHNYFAHVSPSGVTPWHWIGQSGYDYSFAGENLAINFSDPQTQHDAFMNSVTHKKNILNEKYQEIGVAVITGKINGKETIITVQEFGAKTNSLPIAKSVAGITDNKKALASNSSLWENFRSGASPILNSIGQISATTSEKISMIPFVSFLYVLTAIFTLAFFFHEIFTTNSYFATHFLSLRRGIGKFSIEKIKLAPARISIDPSRSSLIKKMYLTHMKLRK